jgi:hypothetical protein
MSIVSIRRHLFAAGLVLALAPAVLTAAPAAPDKDKADSPAVKVRTGLEQVISVEISEQPLDLALKQLHEQTKINFVLDRFTIQQLGFQPEQMPVNVKLKDAKTKSVLRAILTPYQLSYAIIGDTVVVSTDDMAMFKQMRQRINLDFEKEEFASALKKLSRETATNLLVDTRVAKEAKTEVTMQLEDVPLETAVRLMSEMAGLKPVRVGNVLFITSEATATKMRADPDLAQPVGPRGQPMEIMIGPGGLPIQPGGVTPVAPPPAPGIGTVPVNPPPDPTDKPPDKTEKKTEPADKADKDKSDKDKSDKDKSDKDKSDKDKPDAPEKR